MRVDESFSPDPVEKFSAWSKWAAKFATEVLNVLERVTRAINGQLTFGDGVDPDNILGQWVDFTSNGVGGVETAVSHTLGVVPVGFITFIPPAAGTVNKGTTAWTTSTIYITCSAATQSVRVFIMAPPPA